MNFEVTPIGGPGSATPFAIESRAEENSLANLAPEFRKLIDAPIYVTLGMSDGKGRTHLSPMWFRASPDGEHVEINTVKGRAKDRHMRRDGRVTVQITNPENPYQWLTIYGKVDTVIDESGPDGHLATESIDALSQSYINQSPYPFRTETEERVLFLITPTQVVTFGAEER
jgi:PPOX class probable F420-dependent enzyme